MPPRLLRSTFRSLFLLALLGACSANSTSATRGSGGHAGTGGGTGGSGGGAIFGDSGVGDGGTTPSGGVPQTCEASLEKQSYIGCEYWPTVTMNSQLSDTFEFAIVAANPTGSDAVVTVERSSAQIAQVTVAAGQLETIKLPWVTELKNATGSVLVPRGAFHVTSSVPITLYQFNPLDFQQAGCSSTDPTSNCFSYTNDASLLLPTSAMRGEHYVVSRPTLHFGDTGLGGGSWTNLLGFVAVVGTQDGTTVQVATAAALEAGNGVPAATPGQTLTFHLDAGDVLQLATSHVPDQPLTAPGQQCTVESSDPFGFSQTQYCPPPDTYDLTGSHITADKPVAVVGGHDCDFIPFDKYACDHIEETIFPVDTLGQDFFVTAPESVAGITGGNPNAPDNQYIRVLSAAAGNQITFDPPVHAPITLDAGKWIEFGPVSKDFHVLGTDKLIVAQFMVGEDSHTPAVAAGDPAESIAIPTEQYRVEYTFLAPASYTYNYVNIVAPQGTTVTIDGAAIDASEFSAIGSGGFVVARHAVPGGAHDIRGSHNFGIVVYGYGSYTSYMYPGGLNLETIVIGPH